MEAIIKKSIADIVGPRYKGYALNVIQDRALPEVKSGLKPVQMRIIYDMYELGLFSNTKAKKSARIVGDVLGKFHPHGDAACYQALAALSQDWGMRYPLIDMKNEKGQDMNNGSIDGDAPAAMRYTEAKLSKIGEALLTGIDEDTVVFRDNYDSTEKEPDTLPGLIPNLLANGM